MEVSDAELTQIAKRMAAKKKITISSDPEVDLDTEYREGVLRKAKTTAQKAKLKSFLKAVVAKKQATMSEAREAKQKQYFESKEVRDRIRAKLEKAGLSSKKGEPSPIHNTEEFLKRLKSTEEPAFYVVYNAFAYPRVSSYENIERFLTVKDGGPGAKEIKSVSSVMRVSIFHIRTHSDTKEEIEARVKEALSKEPRKSVPIPADLKDQEFVDKETMESYRMNETSYSVGEFNIRAYYNKDDYYLQDDDRNYVKYLTKAQYDTLRKKNIEEHLEKLKNRRTEAKPEPKPEPKKAEAKPKKDEAKKYSEAEKQLGRFLEKYEKSYKFIQKKYKEKEARGFVSLDIKKTSPADWKLIQKLGETVNMIQLQSGVIDDEINVGSDGRLSVFMSNIVDDEARIRGRLADLGRLLTK